MNHISKLEMVYSFYYNKFLQINKSKQISLAWGPLGIKLDGGRSQATPAGMEPQVFI